MARVIQNDFSVLYRAFIARAILKNMQTKTDISTNDKGFYTSNYVYHQNKVLIGKSVSCRVAMKIEKIHFFINLLKFTPLQEHM